MAATRGRFSDLPEEIMVEILARLPVKSLLRFKCVRKSWYALFKNPSFISKHFNHSSSDDDHARIAIKNSGCGCYWNGSGGFRMTTKSFISFLSIEAVHLSQDVPSPFFDRSSSSSSCSEDMTLYGACNGIICVLASSVEEGSFIAFWNPATREIKRLPDSNVPLKGAFRLRIREMIGFGFDTGSNDYKVVKISGFAYEDGYRMAEMEEEEREPPLVEVYSSITDSWRKLDVFLPPAMRISTATPWSVLSNGFCYWCAFDEDNFIDDFVLSFDFAHEVFEKTPLPDINNEYMASTLVKFNETIAFVAEVSENSDESDGCIVLWVLNINGDAEKKRAWTELYRFQIPSVRFVVGFLRSGEPLLIAGDADDGEELKLYDPSDQLLTVLRVYGDSGKDDYQMVDYVESLVSFK